ncbi:MAG: FlgD immunoglobulin-like domain containing protein [candidate division WOR-3 bacterium]
MKRKVVLVLILFLPMCLFSLNFTIEDIDIYNADKPTIGVDGAGHAYIVGNSSGGRDVVRFIQNTGGSWHLDSVPFSAENNINYNCRVSSALDKNQYLHVLYRVTGGTYGWPVYTNNIGGLFTTADTLFKTGSQSTYHYAIAVDNLNRAHIVCEVNSDIRYYYPFADSELVITNNGSDGTITVDKNNVVHIAYTSNSRIYYTNNSSGNFFPAQIVSDTTGMDPSIAADSAGYAHICWTRSNWDSTSELYYATNKSGAFQTTRVTYSTNLCEAWAHIALSRANDIGILYSRYHTGVYVTDIMFAYKSANASDFIIDSIDQGHWNPSYGATTWNDRAIAIDSAGYVHLAYTGTVGSKYAKSQEQMGCDENFSEQSGSRMNLTCFPNPFNRRTEIRLQITNDRFNSSNRRITRSLDIYDVSGRIVKSFLLPESNCLFYWDGTDNAGNKLPDGVYLLKLRVSSNENVEIHTQTNKLILIN